MPKYTIKCNYNLYATTSEGLLEKLKEIVNKDNFRNILVMNPWTKAQYTFNDDCSMLLIVLMFIYVYMI